MSSVGEDVKRMAIYMNRDCNGPKKLPAATFGGSHSREVKTKTYSARVQDCVSEEFQDETHMYLVE